MTLRLRLVVALTALLAVGLAVFGFGTYSAYSKNQYDRLDLQLQDSFGLASRTLVDKAGINQEPGAAPSGAPGQPRIPDGLGGGSGRPALVLTPGTYAELRDAAGKVLASTQFASTSATPAIPTALPSARHAITVNSATGSGEWRLMVATTNRPSGYTILVAIPTNDVVSSLNHLILIEAFAALVLLALLGAGSWAILRHGLRPLETMAADASSISSGDLSARVAPADGRTEVGQLGLALNTMLGEIETAFKERQATEDRLRQFLADASHELRTPLTSIQGFAELSRLESASAHVDRTLLMSRIEEEAARMKRLVEDLLLLARLDQMRPLNVAPVNLAVVCADACTAAAAIDATRKITLTAPEGSGIEGDNDQVRQAVTNLVTNAVKHTPGGTPIEVSAQRVGDNIVVTVRDHGHGLSPEALEHAFDRFWQADPARVGVGSGLGLSIVQGITHAHHGQASAGNHPDGGAIFSLTFPTEFHSIS